MTKKLTKAQKKRKLRRQGKFILASREKLGLTQEELAEAVGCGKNTISHYENVTKSRANKEVIDAILAYLKVELEKRGHPGKKVRKKRAHVDDTPEESGQLPFDMTMYNAEDVTVTYVAVGKVHKAIIHGKTYEVITRAKIVDFKAVGGYEFEVKCAGKIVPVTDRAYKALTQAVRNFWADRGKRRDEEAKKIDEEGK